MEQEIKYGEWWSHKGDVMRPQGVHPTTQVQIQDYYTSRLDAESAPPGEGCKTSWDTVLYYRIKLESEVKEWSETFSIKEEADCRLIIGRLTGHHVEITLKETNGKRKWTIEEISG